MKLKIKEYAKKHPITSVILLSVLVGIIMALLWSARWVIIFAAFLGYIIVSFVPLKKMPPLMLVLGISAMYLGTLESIVWTVQVCKGEALPEILLLLLPICCVCITARTVIYKIKEWNLEEGKAEDTDSKSFVVKPLRLGVRHGHEVIVNRQLCVANAFEQILEEKTPRFHKVVRGVYDKYGFPIGKMIQSKTAADITYFIMKPLEWIFLVVLYLVDVKPENRIAVQYTGKHVSDFPE